MVCEYPKKEWLIHGYLKKYIPAEQKMYFCFKKTMEMVYYF